VSAFFATPEMGHSPYGEDLITVDCLFPMALMDLKEMPRDKFSAFWSIW
jgi:hypothetical protein